MNDDTQKNEILLQGAKDELAEGNAIFPLTPDGKQPLACSLNEQGEIYKWHNGIHSSYSASFGPAREYIVPKTGKKAWTTPALEAWTDGLAVNYAVALELSGLTVADIDEGIADENELSAFLDHFHIPESRCIRSGRVSSFGCHVYYKGVMPSGSFAIPWNGKTVKGEIKSSAPRYVVGEGCYHKSGQRYARLWDRPLEQTPVALFTEILAKYPQTKTQTVPADSDASFEGDAITCEEFEGWVEKAQQDFVAPVFNKAKNAWMYVREDGCPWKHLHTGDNHDTDFAVFVPLQGKMSAKCVHESCASAWTTGRCWTSFREWAEQERGIGRIPLQASGDLSWEKMGSVSFTPTPTPVTVSPEPVPTPEPPAFAPPLVYPSNVWKGTLYYDYAVLCGKGNHIPREFFIESLKTVVGAIASKKLLITNVAGGTSRFYTVLIAIPMAGKNTVIGWTCGLFDDETDMSAPTVKIEDYGHKLLWNPQDIPNKMGACVTKTSSASGLAKFLPKEGSSQEDLLFRYTELSELLEKCQIDGSGLALVSALCDLYEETAFSVPALGDQKPFSGHLRVSILAGIQPERWDDLASGKGVENSGILSRWNLIPNMENKTVATIINPDFLDFKETIRALLLKAVPLVADAGAITAMGFWYDERQKDEASRHLLVRLNILAWKNALHYAWLKGKTTVDAESVAVGTALSDYQLAVRKRYAPLIGDSRLDKAINAIRRYLGAHGTVTMSALKYGVNYTRMNELFEKALAFLVRQGEAERDKDADLVRPAGVL
jgi:Bifunctional DNA primase/polymerase, N-terminal